MSEETDSDLDALMAAELAQEQAQGAPATSRTPSRVRPDENALDADDDILLSDIRAQEAERESSKPLFTTTPTAQRAGSGKDVDSPLHRSSPVPTEQTQPSEELPPSAPPLIHTQAPTGASMPDASSGTLTQKGEEILLRELSALTNTPAPFVSKREQTAPINHTVSGPAGSSTPPLKRKDTPSESHATNGSRAPGLVAAQAQRGTPAQSKSGPPPAATQKSIPRAETQSAPLAEEEAILDAILGSIECLQSTVSGDLTDESDAPGVRTPSRTRRQSGLGVEDAEPLAETKVAEEEEIRRVLAHAEAVASSSLLVDASAPLRKGDCVLSFHEHAALRRALQQPSRSALGRPTCAALRPVPFLQQRPAPGGKAMNREGTGLSNSAARVNGNRVMDALHLALGTSLGAIMLYDDKWVLLGVCGSTEPSVIAQRGGVVSLSIPSIPADTYTTIASGHERGSFILWSAETLAPLRVLPDEFVTPVVQVHHLFCDPFRTLCLEAAGSIKLLTYTRVLSKTMFRSTTITQGHPESGSARGVSAIVDLDVIPHPNVAYLGNVDGVVTAADRGEVPVLFYAPTTSSSGTAAAGGSEAHKGTTGGHQTRELAGAVDLSSSPFVTPGRHLIATVSSDKVLLHVLETGLANVSAPVATHTHPPSSSLSNELVRFVLLEENSPKVLLCVSWNTEIELLRVIFDLEGNVTHLESIAMTTVFSPIQALSAMAGASVLLLDQNSHVSLFDASVAVLVEKHATTALDPVGYTHRMCGVKYRGALTTNSLSAFFLGHAKLFSCALLPWDERLKALLVRRKCAEALELAQSLAEDVALCAVGLVTEPVQRRRALGRYMQAICTAYLHDTLSDLKAQKVPPHSLHVVLDRVLLFCSRVDMLEEVFFGPVMRTLREAQESPAAFVALEKAMLRGVVTSMPDMYVETFFHFFASNPAAVAAEDAKQNDAVLDEHHQGRSFTASRRRDGDGSGSSVASPVVGHPASCVERAESALMHLDSNTECLEKLAKEHHLTRLAVTVASLRRGHYGEALRLALASTAPSPTSPARGECNVALAYMEATMRGASLLPEVDIPTSARVTAKRQVWTQGVGDEKAFFRLLRGSVPPRRFLDVLLLALGETDPPFSPWSEDHLTLSIKYNVARVFSLLVASRAHASGGSDAVVSEHSSATNKERWLLFDKETAERDFRPWELAREPGDVADTHAGAAAPTSSAPTYAASIDHFLCGIVDLIGNRQGRFLVHELCGDAPAWEGLVQVMVQHFMYMFQVADTATLRQNTQTTLTRFMSAVFVHKGPRDSFRRFTREFQHKGMARCLAAVYCADAEYAKAIDCYLDKGNNQAEPGLAEGVFALLRREVLRLEQESASRLDETAKEKDKQAPGSPRGSKAALRELRRAVMEHVGELVQVDATALAQFVFDFLPSNNDDVMKVLKSSSKTFLQYLDELLGKGDVSVASDVNLQNNYIELLCAHEPERVYPYLKQHDSSITYDVQIVLRAVRKYKIADAAVFLLEKTLMMEDAMTVLVAAVRHALGEAREACLVRVVGHLRGSACGTAPENTSGAGTPREEEAPGGTHKTTVEHLLDVGIDCLCTYQRRTSRATSTLWFRLLDALAGPRRVLSSWQHAWQQQTTNEMVDAVADTTATVNPDNVAYFWRHRANELEIAGADDVSVLPQASCKVLEASEAFVSAMVEAYSRYTGLLLRTMIRMLDLSEVVAKIVQDNADETFGPFKPILVDIMGAISFDLEVKRLCQVCVEQDLVELGSSLYRHLNTGIVPSSDTCCLCHRGLNEKPPPVASLEMSDTELLAPAAASSLSSVCVFACGHGFHEVCRAAAASVDGHQGCIQCFLERAGAVRRSRYAFIAEAAASTAATSDTSLLPSSSNAVGGASDKKARGALLARRLRHTRTKLDHGGEYYSALQGFLAAATHSPATATPLGLLRETEVGTSSLPNRTAAASVKKLLRAPAPQLPVSLGELGRTTTAIGGGAVLELDDVTAVVNTLTDAEILELFGDG